MFDFFDVDGKVTKRLIFTDGYWQKSKCGEV